MANEQFDLAEHKTAILDKIDNVLDLRDETWDFLKTKHTAKDTEGRLQEITEFSKDVSKIGRALNARKRSNPPDESAVDALLDSLDRLNSYIVEIHDCLTKDLDRKQHEAAGRKIDFVKNATFIFGLPAVFVTGVRNGIGHGHIGVDEAMYIGFAISIPTVFNKMVGKIYENAAKAICAVPKAVSNDMRVYYAKEIVKERAHNAQLCFATVARSMNDNVRMTSSRTRAGLNRVFRKHGPKP